MPYDFYEIPDSGEMTIEPPSYTKRWKSDGVDDDAFVWNAAKTLTPEAIPTPAGILYRQDLQIAPDGFALKIVTAHYGPKRNVTGSFRWSFDTSGATIKMLVGKEHIGSFFSGGAFDPPDLHKGLIGFRKNSEPEGVQIIIPSLVINCSFTHPLGQISLEQVKRMSKAVGTTNKKPYLDENFDEGELLLLSVSGEDGSEAEATLNYRFAVSESVTGLSFGDIAGIAKEGHHYAWVEYEDKVEDGRGAKQPTIVHIERVYDATDFAELFGWG